MRTSRQDREIGPLPPALPGRRLSSRQQRIIIVSTLRLGAGVLAAIPLVHPSVAGLFGPCVLGWLLGSAVCAIISSYLRVGSRLSPRTGWVGRAVEPVLAAVDVLAFTAVALTAPEGTGYGPVAVLGLVLLGQGPLTWGLRGVALVVLPLTAVALSYPAGLFIDSGGRVALVAVIAGATALGLWLRRLLLDQCAAAEQVQATLSVVFDHSPTPSAITCSSGRILRANPAMAQLCGCDVERLVGRRLLDLVHPDDTRVLERVMASVQRDQAGAGSTGQAMDTRLVGAAGQRWVRLAVAFVPATQGLPAQLVVQAEDVEEIRATTARLEHEATHDTLTGLPNRRAVHRALGRLTDDGGPEDLEGSGGPAEPRAGALVLVDLDDFKAVNDELGHEAGDELLVLAAARLRSALHDGESAGRLAGDELVVIAEDVGGVGGATGPGGAEGARELGERVVAALVGPARLRAGDVRLRASAGVSRVTEGDDASAVLRRADDALYRAKRAGGCRVEVAPTPRPALSRVTAR